LAQKELIGRLTCGMCKTGGLEFAKRDRYVTHLVLLVLLALLQFVLRAKRRCNATSLGLGFQFAPRQSATATAQPTRKKALNTHSGPFLAVRRVAGYFGKSPHGAELKFPLDPWVEPTTTG